MEFKYEIGGRTFYQRPLVLGQVKQLISAFKGIILPTELTVSNLAISLGDKTPQILAILITEDNILLKNKNIDEVQELIENNLSLEMAIKVIEDFFDCNPITLVSEALIGLTTKIRERVTQTISSTGSVLSLGEEILPKEMTSSGDTPLANADPI